VTDKPWILLLLSVTMIFVLAGCNSGSTFSEQNPPPPPGSTLSITFSPAPAASVLVNATTPVTAVVNNDPTNAGVEWLLSCASGNCGSLSLPHTSSGQATVYTPPSTLTGNTEIVNIAGYASADQFKNVLTSITVTAFGNNLSGPYVLAAQAVDSSSNLYQFAGVLVLDGNGGVSSGEQTINYVNLSGAYVSETDSGVISQECSYFLGPDGRGTMTVAPANSGDIASVTFGIIYLSPSQALLVLTSITFKDARGATGVSGTGTMDAQTWTSSAPALSGGYAFVLSGVESGSPNAIGGVFNIDSLPNNPDNISGAGSVADQNFAGTVIADVRKLTGNAGNPDSFGGTMFNFNVVNPSTTFSPTTFQLTGYVVDGIRIKLIESDANNIVAGIALGQGSATGNFVDPTSFSGTYVFGVLGTDLANSNTTPSTLTSAGVVTADGQGDLTGQTNVVLVAAQADISFTLAGGSYGASPDTASTGRFFASFHGQVPNQAFGAKFLFYLTGNGTPALFLAFGENALYPFLGAGIAYPQSAPPLTFNGTYGLNFTQYSQSLFYENDGTGWMTANSTLSPPLSGIADVNLAFTFTPDLPFSGTYSAPSSNGVFSATLTGNNSVFDVSPFAGNFYIIDPGHGFWVETDSFNSAGTGTGVATFGYYAPQTAPQSPVGSSAKRRRR